MKIKIKRIHGAAVIPSNHSDGAAGFDLVAVDADINYKKGFISYKTGLCMEIPKGYAGFIFPRSSIRNTVHSFANSVAVIDSDYRGEIIISMRFKEFQSLDLDNDVYKVGDRIGQMIIMPIPEVTYQEEAELSDTKRGKKGFGSTGR